MKRIKAYTYWMWWTVMAVGLGVGLTCPTLVEATNFTFTKVADTSTFVSNGVDTFASFDDPLFSNGHVAFQGFDSVGNPSIYTDVNGGLTLVADTSTLIPGSPDPLTSFYDFDTLSFSNGHVAFQGFDSVGNPGIYTDVSGSLTVVADTSTLLPNGVDTFVDFDAPLFANGHVAFRGLDSAGNLGIYTDVSGSLTTVADTNTPVPNGAGPFLFFDAPLFANEHVVFLGFDSAGNPGIYTDLNGVLESVIDLSVPLEIGKTLVYLGLGPQDLSGNALAFYAAFDDGSEGIYRADAIVSPEPSTFLLLTIGLTSLLGYGWRRRKRAL